MEFTWSETKRASNVTAHGLDFLDARSVFDGLTYTFEDDRLSYGEQRFVTLGLLAGIPVSVVHTENDHEIRIISFRKATKRESKIYVDAIQNRLGAPEVRRGPQNASTHAPRSGRTAYCSRYGSPGSEADTRQSIRFTAR